MSLYIVAASIFVFDPWEMLIDTALARRGQTTGEDAVGLLVLLGDALRSCVLFAAA